MNIPLFSGSIGINNKVEPHRLPFDPETGVVALESATDVLIDKSGALVTRRGSASVQTGSFHSRFVLSDGSFYVVKDRETDSALYKAVPDSTGALTLYGIRSSLTKGARMDFALFDGGYLYCNGSQNGYIVNDVSDVWPVNDWTGPESTIEMTSVPVGQHIDILAGRVLLSVGPELFYTEHGLVGLIDETGNRIRIEGNLRMVYSVQSGVYISDDSFVYFLSGNNPKEWKCKIVLNYPAIEWGREQGFVNPSDFGIESKVPSALFVTTKGPVVGLPDGACLNLISKNITMPSGCGNSSGAIMVQDESLIIQNII